MRVITGPLRSRVIARAHGETWVEIAQFANADDAAQYAEYLNTRLQDFLSREGYPDAAKAFHGCYSTEAI